MIIGDDLRAWAASHERRRECRLAAQAFAERWTGGPVHAQFTHAMANLPSPTVEAVIEAVTHLFTDDDWVKDLLGDLADEMRRDPFFIPPLHHLNSDIHSGLIVFEDENVTIAIGLTSVIDLAAKKSRARDAASIAFSGQVEILKFVRGGALLSFWKAPPITADFTAASAGRCERTGERRIADGEIVVVDGRCEGFAIEQSAANLFVLQATVKPDRAPLSVEYDFATREYVGCSAADDSASRIQMLTTLLRKLNSAQAFDAIADFLDHKSFFVRWHVMRELLGLDLRAALPHLKRMAARDPHPETRRAARGVLDRIEHGNPSQAAA